MATRRCKCGCGPFEPDRSNQKYRAAACRTRAYRERRAHGAPSRHRSVTRPSRQTRYALIARQGAVVEILGFAAGRSKRAVERAFGMSGRDDLAAIAERYLPAVV